MLIVAIIIFTTTAFGGIVLASHVIRRQFAPWVISLGHAILGASGLGFLIGLLLKSGGEHQVLIASLGTLCIAALGGFTLAGFHLTGKLPPRGSVLAHAAVATLGFLMLISIVLL